ncbi:hypothetical protein DYY66_2247 [Candidatus Nitrosotalea sp. FS]|nr:hypothetical protein [Candidatus Nitrosotalea sp. FS]
MSGIGIAKLCALIPSTKSTVAIAIPDKSIFVITSKNQNLLFSDISK